VQMVSRLASAPRPQPPRILIFVLYFDNSLDLSMHFLLSLYPLFPSGFVDM
jgi:hypothetical protein